jgi:tetratricopeptide (TPR) repeat protein
MLLAGDRPREALAEIDAVLPETIAVCGEDSGDVSILLFNRGVCRERLGDLEGAEAELRHSLAIKTRVFGPESTVVARTMGKLAEILMKARKSLPEAEDLARRCLDILRASSSESLELASSLRWLSAALALRGAWAESVPYMVEALALLERQLGRGDRQWAECATDAVVTFACSGRVDEAEQLLDQLAKHPNGPTPGWTLRFRAYVQWRRGNLEDAVELYDQAISLMAADPRDKENAPAAFTDFAALLRQMGDEAGAVEVEHRAAELPK